MKLYSEHNDYKLYEGNMLDLLQVVEESSVDSIVTDPPYELGFMGKSWDNSGIAFQKETWEQCYKALKPGGHLLAFGGTRTYHRIACAIEDAGFEIRDTIKFETKTKVFNGKSDSSSEDMKDVEKRFTTNGKNIHPTVKPTSLMQYLVRLVTPNNGTVLDPFNGSGSTGKAVMYENLENNKGYKYIGIELTPEYLPISKARLDYVCGLPRKDKEKTSLMDLLGEIE